MRGFEALRRHYEVEKRLAARLRAAPRERHSHMLPGLYDELFREVPEHPRARLKLNPERARPDVEGRIAFVRPLLRPEMTLLEIGPGDCAFSLAAAKHVRQVYAVDVHPILPPNVDVPPNVCLLQSDGVSVPVPRASVHVAYSDQVMEHLHPDDAREQLANIFAALVPGGLYVCFTPNRLDGPHDVSRDFSDQAEGFHLKEYTLNELEAVFREAGFRHLAAYRQVRGARIRVPLALLKAVERVLARAPVPVRRALARRRPLRLLLNPGVVARR